MASILDPSSPVVSLASLPSGPTVVFEESSYFSRNPGQPFPTLSEVRAESARQHSDRDHRKDDPPPVIFESLGLLVKYGKCQVHIPEGQTLWALKRFLPEVPVPEIYGWTTEGDYVLFYMEIVEGVTIEKRWPYMTDDEKAGFWKGMRAVVDNLRKLSQEPNDRFLGRIDRSPLYDVAFENSERPRPGPFTAVSQFHDWLSITIRTGFEMHWPGKKPEEIPDPYREQVPDSAAITFTHSDLHPSNIMVDPENPSTIVAVIDWAQSGWYPDYWEFCKAEYTADPTSEWQQYLMKYLDEPDEVTLDGFLNYTRALGS